ncbi:cyclase family protein [Chroococcidiopsis sp. FACHB-1243]|uniref:cyclase family protein n=1 Tax=Chroococcidiopsis sp. [FACHB-1243] TaxID=2692781 RepID=UPI00177DBB80|nr:cyclase family protein [Chroococcidiopsis sp. [FACHB-1243]]MBD2304110.1 cyclase family protein [Chroococcidiopsis sp. [FACHB-1243]]
MKRYLFLIGILILSAGVILTHSFVVAATTQPQRVSSVTSDRIALDERGNENNFFASLPVLTKQESRAKNRRKAFDRLIESVSAARIIELNFTWDTNSPLFPTNTPYSISLLARHTQTFGTVSGGIGFATDKMDFSGQHGAPTIDAIGHISNNLKLFGDIDAATSESDLGLTKLGVEAYPKEQFVNRAVLLDVARFKGVETLAAGQEITVADLEATARAEGVEIQSGDSVLIRTGYGKFFNTEPTKFSEPLPGPGEAAARWLAKKKVFLVGDDQLVFEVLPATGTVFPVHRTLIADNGIYIVENLNLEELSQALAQEGVYEFPLVLNPPRIRGATGAAVNSFAILPR